ncbi:MAG TPA: class I SAM-dependent methyltransferase [Gammaproteobacteria bacterium]|nr:class I SAM-dependent methyltransferase [Gammaproteobacteria bacterium]
MGFKPAFTATWLASLLIAVMNPTHAQLDPKLDVPYVPTREVVVQAMLDVGQVSSSDLLYDLGSGDGRIVVTAAKERGTRGVGVDLDPQRVREAKANAKQAGVEDKVTFIEGNLFETDFSKATVVTMYLLPAVNLQLRPRILSDLRPGTRIVSHSFDMGDWQPDQQAQISGSYVYLWIVPAPVAGTWQWRTADGKDYRLELAQQFQQVSGKAWIDGRPAQLQAAELTGDQLRLTVQADDTAAPASFSARYIDGRLVGIPDGAQATAAAQQVVWEKVGGGAG